MSQAKTSKAKPFVFAETWGLGYEVEWEARKLKQLLHRELTDDERLIVTLLVWDMER